MQVNPATVAAPVHAVPTVGVIHVAPLQYSDPDTLPAPVHTPPKTAPAVQSAGLVAHVVPVVPPPVVQKPDVQVNPPAVAVPVHGVPTVGVTHVAPLQYSDPDTLPAPVHTPPKTAPPVQSAGLVAHVVPVVPPTVVQKPAVQVNPATVAAPVHEVPTAGVIQVAPLQYSEPDTLPVPVHAPPATVPPVQSAGLVAQVVPVVPPVQDAGLAVHAATWAAMQAASQLGPVSVGIPFTSV